MSWKSDPKIRELEPYTRKNGYRYVVLFAVDDAGNQFTITTYGTTKQNCQVAKIAGDQLHELVEQGLWPDWEKAVKIAEAADAAEGE